PGFAGAGSREARGVGARGLVHRLVGLQARGVAGDELRLRRLERVGGERDPADRGLPPRLVLLLGLGALAALVAAGGRRGRARAGGDGEVVLEEPQRRRLRAGRRALRVALRGRGRGRILLARVAGGGGEVAELEVVLRPHRALSLPRSLTSCSGWSSC